ARTGKSLDRAANRLQGDAALVSKASSRFLERLRLLGDDFAAKTRLLNSKVVLDLKGVLTKEELQSRELIVRQFIEANDQFGSFSQNQDEIYRDELVKGGVSSASIATAMEAFQETKATQKPWDA